MSAGHTFENLRWQAVLDIAVFATGPGAPSSLVDQVSIGIVLTPNSESTIPQSISNQQSEISNCATPFRLY